MKAHPPERLRRLPPLSPRCALRLWVVRAPFASGWQWRR